MGDCFYLYIILISCHITVNAAVKFSGSALSRKLGTCLVRVCTNQTWVDLICCFKWDLTWECIWGLRWDLIWILPNLHILFSCIACLSWDVPNLHVKFLLRYRWDLYCEIYLRISRENCEIYLVRNWVFSPQKAWMVWTIVKMLKFKHKGFLSLFSKIFWKVTIAVVSILLCKLLFNHEKKPRRKDSCLKYFVFILICNEMDSHYGTWHP